MEKDIKPVVSFVEHVVRGLVEDPNSIEVVGRTDERGGLVTMKVPSSQMSKIIGKGGRTIRSVTVLVRSMGKTLGMRTSLKVEELYDKPKEAPHEESDKNEEHVAVNTEN